MRTHDARAPVETEGRTAPVTNVAARPRSISLVAAAAAGLLGVAGLLGWILDIAALRSILPGLSTMKANTALAVVLGAAALGLSQSASSDPWVRRSGQVLALVVAAVGLLTLLEYVAGWDLGLDQLLFRDQSSPPGTRHPGRMGVNTATSFFLLGVALLLRTVRRQRPQGVAEALVLSACAIALLSLLGYAYHVTGLTRVVSDTQMALHTALAIVMLCTGVLFSRTDGPITALTLAAGPGGMIVRRLVPATFVMLFLIGEIRLRGQQLGLYGTEFGVALTVILSCAAVSTALLWGAAQLHRVDADRSTAEMRFRTVVESAPSGMVMVNREGRIVLVNREIERLFGYAREDLLGQAIELLVPQTVQGRHPRFRTDFSAHPQARAMGAGRDLFGRRKDGSEVPVEIGLNPIETDEGLFVLASVVDISARQRAEARFRAAVESSPNGMVMVESGGQIVLVNREIERLFGYAREELLGQPIELLVPQQVHARHPGLRTDFFARPQTRAMGAGRDLFGRRKDGSEVPVEIGLNPIETDEGLFVLASVVDISARKRAELDLRRSNADLEQFAYVASHDLQEPLRMVASYTQLLRKRYRGKLDADADEFIGYAVDGATRMQQLISDLLTYSRVGTRAHRLEPTDCDALLSRVLGDLRVAVEQNGAVVTHDPLPTVLGDETQLGQLFQNLLSNALKFRGADPPRVHVSAERNGSEVKVSVRDNGIGIAPEHVERIFVIFQRLHTTAQYAGTGIGLAVCKKIVERHGGRIWVESHPGQGATFCFTLSLLLTRATSDRS